MSSGQATPVLVVEDKAEVSLRLNRLRIQTTLRPYWDVVIVAIVTPRSKPHELSICHEESLLPEIERWEGRTFVP